MFNRLHKQPISAILLLSQRCLSSLGEKKMSNDLIEEEEAIFNKAAVALPFSSRAVHDLLTLGVCVRCIFRLSGVRGHVYSCSLITSSMLCSILKEKYNENGFDLEDDGSYCCICLGILQFACDRGNESSVEGFVGKVAELIGREGYQIDGFCLELSVPAVVVANERALWLYMRRIYDCEKWFKNWFPLEQISVKDALRLSITSALERRLNVKCGVDSFRLRLTFTHLESSAKLQHSLVNDRGFKRRKIVLVPVETEGTKDDVVDSNDSNKKDSNERLHSEADAAILRAVNSLQDYVFIELFPLPPQKVYKSCQLTTTCLTMPMYIGGRYLKFSRKVSQSRWIIDDERMGAASVEEIVGSNALSICKGDSYKFHAAGREDIDVRMLGSGRPFLIEVSNARCMPSMVDVQQIAETINNSIEKYVRVRNLKVVGSEVWNLMREGEAEKQKQYAAVVWTSQALTDENLDHISSIKNMEILQSTPVRVLHRRSPLERKRIIHWMKIEKLTGNCQYILLHLCTQAGTYIKEFVHGDLGRTHPSLGTILGCRAEILQLDVTDVRMDFFE